MKSVTFLVLSGLLLSFVNARPVIVSQIWTAVSTEEDFNDYVKFSDDKLVILEFYTKWCSPCITAIPYLNKLALKYPNVIMLKSDFDESTKLSQRFPFSSVPAFYFLKEGEVVKTMNGFNFKEIEKSIIEFDTSTPKKI